MTQSFEAVSYDTMQLSLDADDEHGDRINAPFAKYLKRSMNDRGHFKDKVAKLPNKLLTLESW